VIENYEKMIFLSKENYLSFGAEYKKSLKPNHFPIAHLLVEN